MKVLVCGGRKFGATFVQQQVAFEALDEIHKETPITLIVNGGANGADRIGADWGVVHKVVVHTYPANWHKYGRSAGPIRNKQMVTEEEIDLVVAFPGGNGTANMVRQALLRDIPIKQVKVAV